MTHQTISKSTQLIVLGRENPMNRILSQKIIREYPKAIIDLTIEDTETLIKVMQDIREHLTNIIFVLMPDFTLKRTLEVLEYKGITHKEFISDIITFSDLNLS